MNAYDDQDWLEQFHASRPSPISGLAERFELVINTAEREEDLQKFLAENPFILAEQLPHCHYVVPKFRFGGRYVSDFILPEIASSGWTWVLVELEPVDAQLVTQSGYLAERVRAGIQQVKDWRDWLMDNRHEAIRPRSRNGLGLWEIDDIWGWVVIGRRSQVTDRFNQLRKQVFKESRIDVMTYDRLLEWFKVRAAHWEEWDRSVLALTQSPRPKAGA